MTATDFRNVMSSVADSIVIVDQEGIICFANPSAEALFGRNLKELLGKPFGFPRIMDQTTEIEVSFEEIPKGIIALIPPAWEYPEITCARIILNSQEFKTENFKETNWKQSSDIFVHGTQAGVLEA